MRVRERPPLRLSANIETPDGTRHRWGTDEPDAANIPNGLRFSSTMPGGFESCDLSLPRLASIEYGDLKRLSTVTIYGPGGDVAWEGRLEGAPRAGRSVAPRLVGWQAHLDDRKDAQMVYVDRELSRWGQVSASRRLALANASRKYTAPQITPDATNGAPTLVLKLDEPWTANSVSEALYDGGPGLVDSVYYNYVFSSLVSAADGNWYFNFQSYDADDLSGASENTGDLHGAGLSGSGYFTPVTERRYIVAQLGHGLANTTAQGRDFLVTIWNVAVYGDHGITRRGTAPGGLYADDVVRHVISNFCTELTYTSESIQVNNTFAIPHLAFHEHTTPAEIIRQASRFSLPDWGVWENKTVYWAPRGTFGRSWRARVGPAQLEESGASVERLWNSVIVEYRDVDGTMRTVGPVGSGADTTSSSLEDTDPENPANKLGIVRRTKLSMGTSTPAGAVQIGARFLEETKALDSSGKATLTGHVEDDKGVLHPVWRVRAGDTITFVDAQDPSERRIVRADYTHATRSCSIDIDAPPEGIAALLERLNVVLVPMGL